MIDDDGDCIACQYPDLPLTCVDDVDIVAELRVAFAPEAVEYCALLKGSMIHITQDDYGRVMGFLSKMPERDMQVAFLGAMIDAGYPRETAHSLSRIMGLSL